MRYTAKSRLSLRPDHDQARDPHAGIRDGAKAALKCSGRIRAPGELTYSKDIYRYYEALDKASDRVTMWKIGQTEEGRDMVLLAVADEATIKQLGIRGCSRR